MLLYSYHRNAVASQNSPTSLLVMLSYVSSSALFGCPVNMRVFGATRSGTFGSFRKPVVDIITPYTSSYVTKQDNLEMHASYYTPADS